MSKSKTKNKTAAIIILIVGAIAFGGIGFYGYTLYANDPKLFTTYKKNRAEKIYASLTDVDFTVDYPDSAEEVMEHYINITDLIYGNYIQDITLVDELMGIMQAFYSSEIRSLNPLDLQIENVKHGLASLSASNTYTIGYSIDPLIYSSGDLTTATAKVIAFTNNGGNTEWKYYLTQNSATGNWEISNREVVSGGESGI